MELAVCERSDELYQEAANWCRTKIQTHRAKSTFIPAGQTPVPLYELWEQTRPEYLKGVDLLQIDDVLTGPKAGLFRNFFEQHLPSFQSQITYIDEAERGAELGILGLGLNGHVAFHEPHIQKSFFSGCVHLGDVTCDHLKIERGTWGISYGVGAFLKCRAVLMIVQGASKRDVLRRLLDRDAALPASWLMDHPDFTLLVDRDAYLK